MSFILLAEPSPAPILAVAAAGVAILIALALAAIATKRPLLAAVIGGGTLVAIGIVCVVVVIMSFRGQAHVASTEWHVGPVSVEQHFDETSGGIQQFGEVPGGIETGGAHRQFHLQGESKVLAIALPVLILILFARRLMSPRRACGHWRLWPAFFVLPLIALFLLGNIRYRSSGQYSGSTVSMLQSTTPAPPQQSAMLARHVAKMNAQAQRQIAQTDIRQEIDQWDAPRIPLPPQPPHAPATAKSPSEAASSENKSSVASKETENAASETANTADEANVKETKTNQAAAEAKPPKKSNAKKTNSSKREKPAPAAAPAAIAESPERPAPGRPAWVDNPPKRVGDVQREVVITDEWSTDEECERARDIAVMLKTYEHIQRLVGLPYQGYLLDRRLNTDNSWNDARLRELAAMGVTLDYVRRNIAKDEYLETAERSVGLMKRLYTLVEFSPAVDSELRRLCVAQQRQTRFAVVGAGAGSILGLLCLAFGLLKVDTWTKGYYTKRLFLGVPAAIIGGALLILLIDMAH